MLGENRPAKASRRATSMVDRIVTSMEGIRLAAEAGRPTGHHEAVLKDTRKSLLRYIGSLERDSEEIGLMEKLVDAVAGLKEQDLLAYTSADKAFDALRDYRNRKPL
jgi:hypothetical protein